MSNKNRINRTPLMYNYGILSLLKQEATHMSKFNQTLNNSTTIVKKYLRFLKSIGLVTSFRTIKEQPKKTTGAKKIGHITYYKLTPKGLETKEKLDKCIGLKIDMAYRHFRNYELKQVNKLIDKLDKEAIKNG